MLNRLLPLSTQFAESVVGVPTAAAYGVATDSLHATMVALRTVNRHGRDPHAME